eukprot:10697169-Lingulodinium_polyedra.AAC.1
MRAEFWERRRRHIEDRLRRGLYHEPFDPARPWAAVLRDSARDDRFWQQHVVQRALVALARGTPRRLAISRSRSRDRGARGGAPQLGG